MSDVGGVLRHVRRARGESQRQAAAAAGVSATALARVESGGSSARAVDLLHALGWALHPAPEVVPTAEEVQRLRRWLCRHPLDRLADGLLEQRSVLGRPPREGTRRVLQLVEGHPSALLVGGVARRIWLPPDGETPLLEQVEMLDPTGDPAADLPRHVWRTAEPTSWWTPAARVLCLRDVLLLQGWSREVALALGVWEQVQPPDQRGRQEAAHLPHRLLTRTERQRGHGDGHPTAPVRPPPWWQRRRDPRLWSVGSGPALPAVDQDATFERDGDIEEWDPLYDLWDGTAAGLAAARAALRTEGATQDSPASRRR